jgi:hypothetical protein
MRVESEERREQMLGAPAASCNLPQQVGPPLLRVDRLAEDVNQAMCVALDARQQVGPLLAVCGGDPAVELARCSLARVVSRQHQLLLQAYVAVERQSVGHCLCVNGLLQRAGGAAETRQQRRLQALQGAVGGDDAQQASGRDARRRIIIQIRLLILLLFAGCGNVCVLAEAVAVRLLRCCCCC